jgi:acetate kinase
MLRCLLAQEPLSDHTAALDYVLNYLRLRYSNNIKEEVEAMGHRVVHGKHISEPVLVNEEVMQVIKEAAELAPLHNPANLQGIVAASLVFPDCPQVKACYDSSTSHSLSTHAKLQRSRSLKRVTVHTGRSIRHSISSIDACICICVRSSVRVL